MGFLPDQTSRKHLILPTQVNVDFRAACFCHKRVVDIGFVCSICLSSMYSWVSSTVNKLNLTSISFLFASRRSSLHNLWYQARCHYSWTWRKACGAGYKEKEEEKEGRRCCRGQWRSLDVQYLFTLYNRTGQTLVNFDPIDDQRD